MYTQLQCIRCVFPQCMQKRFSGACESCLHIPRQRTDRETVTLKARAVTDDIISAPHRSTFRVEQVIFMEQT